MNDDQTKKLKAMMEHTPMAFVGPYSGAFRIISKIEGEYLVLDNENKIHMSTLDPNRDFAMVTRMPL